MRTVNGFVYVYQGPDYGLRIWGSNPMLLQFSFPDIFPHENVAKVRADLGLKPKIGAPFYDDEAYISEIDLRVAEDEGDEQLLVKQDSLVICVKHMRTDRRVVWKFLGPGGRNILNGHEPYRRGAAALKKLGELRCRGEMPILVRWQLTKVFDLRKDVVTTES